MRRRAKQDYKGIIASFGYSKITCGAASAFPIRQGRHCTLASSLVNEPRTVAGRTHSRGRLAAGPVAQWLEPAAHNGLVAGSSPAGPTTLRPSCRAKFGPSRFQTIVSRFTKNRESISPISKKSRVDFADLG